MLDITIIVSLIAAIAAITAPVITKFSESRTQIKLKKMELIYNHKRMAYHNFTKSYIDFVYTFPTGETDYLAYIKDFQEAYLICDKHTRVLLKELSLIINRMRAFPAEYDVLTSKAYDSFDKIIVSMSVELDRY